MSENWNNQDIGFVWKEFLQASILLSRKNVYVSEILELLKKNARKVFYWKKNLAIQAERQK